jgi:hypothetical protein
MYVDKMFGSCSEIVKNSLMIKDLEWLPCYAFFFNNYILCTHGS